MDERAQAIAFQINAAFADVPMPTPEPAATLRTRSLDERWCAEQFGGRPRNEFTTSNSLNLFVECLHWMPLTAAHYYFPAFLLHCLAPERCNESGAHRCVIGYLDRRSTRDYPPFSPVQRRCIVEWLEFVRENIDRFDFQTFRDRYTRRLTIIRDQWAAA